jgi:pimeloyl-ACP methyl ester carboxylesterase
VLRLSDGRRLGYAEYGDPGGAPALFFHGTPGSRRVASWADRAAKRRGIRLIAPERPGFGLSDFQPGRRLAAWPADVVELADALGLARFAVAGVSGGGPYVVACAAKIPGRLTHAAIISGIGPLDDPALAAELPRAWRAGFAVARRLPAALRAALGLGRLGLHHAPRCVLASVAGSLPEVDRAILRRPQVRALLLDDAREALRHGTRGAVQELLLFSRPWGVPPSQIRMPVRLWHGQADAQVPLPIARRLAAALPDCRASFLPDAGHLWVLDHLDEVLATLA